MSEALLAQAARKLLEDGVSRPVDGFLYAASGCGGGEIGLYTLLGGYFRRLLEKENARYRLWINAQLSGTSYRPDFQVHFEETSEQPVFVAEFKWISEEGHGGASPRLILDAIAEDVGKLRSFLCVHPGLRTAALVFLRSRGAEPDVPLCDALHKLGFDLIGGVELWKPETIPSTGHLHLFILYHEHVCSFGDRRSGHLGG